jgi:hypothetical protein
MPSQEDIEAQQELLAAHRRTLAHLLIQQAQFGAGYAPAHVSNGIQEARDNIARVKRNLRDWDVHVEDHPDDVEIPFQNKVLNNTLTTYFSENAIKDLVSLLKIDYEALGGDNEQDKSLELVLYCQKHGLIDALRRAIEEAPEGVYLISEPTAKQDKENNRNIDIPEHYPSEIKCKYCKKVIRLIDLEEHRTRGIELSLAEYDFIRQKKEEGEQTGNWNVTGVIVCRNCGGENPLIEGYITSDAQGYTCFNCKQTGLITVQVKGVEDWPASTFVRRITFVLICEYCNQRGSRRKLLRSFQNITSLLFGSNGIRIVRTPPAATRQTTDTPPLPAMPAPRCAPPPDS